MLLDRPRKSFVLKKLIAGGLAGYEAESLACFLAMADNAAPGVVVDVGANVGVYSALAASATDREVWGFEPTPELASFARSFAQANGLRYEVEQLALGSYVGIGQLYLSAVTDSSNSLTKGFRPSERKLDIQVETLDAWMSRHRITPAVVKIDVESAEPAVLEGALDTLQHRRPWVLCEVLAGRVESDLTKLMKPFGYHWYNVTDDLPYVEREEIIGDRTHRYLMWMFAPTRPAEAFWRSVQKRRAQIDRCRPVE